jgi:AGCS family alanine or glycine:cation symporter
MIVAWLNQINGFYWEYIGVPLLILFGLYLTIKTKGFQFHVLRHAIHQVKTFFEYADTKGHGGIHPLKLYFASVGGSIGIGNIVNVTAGFAIGGPGVLFWLWLASFLGTLIKYSEIFLGIKYREQKPDGYYNGGFMYVIRNAFHAPLLSKFAAAIMCIYGCEVYQFSVVADTVYRTYPIDKHFVVFALLGLTVFCAIGGIRRLANICSVLMPVFLIVYILLCLYVIGHSYAKLPDLFLTVFRSAFTGHAALGGFIGSSFIMTMKEGVSRAVYAGDIGVGYDSMIQSETSAQDPRMQARFSMISLFSNTLICTLSILVVLCSGVWCTDCAHNFLVTETFNLHFAYAKHFMAILLFLAGFTTIISFLTVGYKSATFISERWGKIVYSFYAVPALVIFSFCDNTTPQVVMAFCSGLLLCVNLISIFRLRKEIAF